MYKTAGVLLLAAVSSVQAVALAEPVYSNPLARRSIQQGWSIQASSAPDGTTSCGNGAYCPSSLHCNPAKNAEVAACCTDPSNCSGAVEGAPVCADSSWNMWIGNDGNGFCCEVGLVGVFDSSKKSAGCVQSADVGSSSTAVLTSTGTGATATSSASTATTTGSSSTHTGSSSSTSTSSSTTSTSTSTSGSEAKAVGMGLIAAGLMAIAAL